MKKALRKLMGLVAAALFCLPAVSCGKEGVPPGGEVEVKVGNRVTALDSRESVGLTTGNITLIFDKTNGSLVSLKAGESELAGGTGGGNFTLYVDTDTAEIFDAREDFKELTRVSSRGLTLSEYTFSNTADGKKLDMTFDAAFTAGGAAYNGIRVRQTVAVDDYGSEATVTYSVENNCAGTTVVALVAAQLGGIASEKNYTLFWPIQEGELNAGAVAAAKAGTLDIGRSESQWKDRDVYCATYSYPSPLSMSLAQLYNESESLYLYASDPSNEFKKFNFGVFDDGKQNHYDAGLAGNCSLSVTQYPYVAAGERRATYPLVVGVGGGGWFDGSDSYRTYKLTQPLRSKSYTQKVRDCHAIYAHTACGKNASPNMCYDLSGDVGKNFTSDIASQAAWVDEMGIDDMILIGWSDKGFDMNYPDYGFMPAMGTAADFKSGIDKAHQNGDKVFPYLNAWAVQQNSDWWDADGGAGDRAAVKLRSFDGTNYDVRHYYRLGEFIAACPGSKDFMTAFTAAAERLAASGADGLWLDQLMEMPAALCFDKTHGHRTPATAYGEGMDALMTAVRGVFDKYSDDYYFVCEGLCDAYISYVDIPGSMWGRPLSFAESAAPEITRYTIPSKILGLWNRDDAITTPAEHAIACYLGDPLLMQGGSKNPYSRKYIELYRKFPEVYEDGRFMADRGVTSSADALKIGVYAGADKMIVTAYNLSGRDVTAELSLSLESLGYGKDAAVRRVYNATDPAKIYAFKGAAFTAEVGQNSIASYVIELA